MKDVTISLDLDIGIVLEKNFISLDGNLIRLRLGMKNQCMSSRENLLMAVDKATAGMKNQCMSSRENLLMAVDKATA